MQVQLQLFFRNYSCFYVIFCRFPCAETTKLLINCGADVNAMDKGRNTPLHVIVNYHKAISDFMTLHTIITELTDKGAHIDCVNSRGETPLDSSATGNCSFEYIFCIFIIFKILTRETIKLRVLISRGCIRQIKLLLNQLISGLS